MAELKEIDYGSLIDRLIQDFPPVKRLWPVSIRLSLWLLLEAAILIASVLLSGRPDAFSAIYFHEYWMEGAAFFLVSIIAAWIALRNSIPGRETGPGELTPLVIAIIAAALTTQVEPLSHPLLSPDSFSFMLGRQWSLAALPWVALFWAAQRAVPLRPRLTGGMIGVAASSFAIAADLFAGPGYPATWQLFGGAILTVLSFFAGVVWLDPKRLWGKDSGQSADRLTQSGWLKGGAILPVAAAFAAGLLLLVLRVGISGNERVPDFDLAIDNYQHSLTNFHPNVPSSSIATVLTAYIDHGMPSYMWDFGPQGFKLVGGRFEYSADGTPVTYTWFRGTQAGVMCMFRQVSGFEPPSATHIERDHLLFYRYRGYSVCLLNVGGYGDFISVIVSPVPMKVFMHMVFAALGTEPKST